MDEQAKALTLLERIANAVEHLAMRQHFVPLTPAESTEPSDPSTAPEPGEVGQTAPANIEQKPEVDTTSASE